MDFVIDKDRIANLNSSCSCVTNGAMFGQFAAKGTAANRQGNIFSTNTKRGNCGRPQRVCGPFDRARGI